jgi:hypothetical protein
MKGLGLYMNRILTICLALVLLVASSSFATRTRLLTLGEQYDVVIDDANIWRYPSRLYNYPKMAIGEVGYAYAPVASSDDASGGPIYTDGMEFQQLGIHWQFCCKKENPSVLAIYLHNAEVDEGTVSEPYWGDFSLVGDVFNDYDLLPNKRITLAYSRMMGGNPWGATFSWVHSSQSYTYSDTSTAYENEGYKYAEGFNQFRLRVGTTMGGGNADLSFGATMSSWKDQAAVFNGTEYETFDESEPSGNFQFDVAYRRFLSRDCDYTFVPHAMLAYEHYGITWNGWDGTDQFEDEKASATILRLKAGLGWNWTPSEDVLAVFDGGASYSHTSGKYEYVADTSSTTYDEKYTGTEFVLFYLHSGFEATMFPWLTVRAGASTNWDWNTGTVEEEDNPEEWKDTYKENYSSNDTYLGVGFHWGEWHIDSHIDPAWLLNGPYWLTGESNTMNWGLSVLRPF